MLKIITNTETPERYLFFHKSDGYSIIQESPWLLQNMTINCHIQRSPTLIRIMSQTSSPHLSPYLLNTEFKNRNQQICMYFLSLICYITCSSHLPSNYQSNGVRNQIF